MLDRRLDKAIVPLPNHSCHLWHWHMDAAPRRDIYSCFLSSILDFLKSISHSLSLSLLSFVPSYFPFLVCGPHEKEKVKKWFVTLVTKMTLYWIFPFSFFFIKVCLNQYKENPNLPYKGFSTKEHTRIHSSDSTFPKGQIFINLWQSHKNPISLESCCAWMWAHCISDLHVLSQSLTYISDHHKTFSLSVSQYNSHPFWEIQHSSIQPTKPTTTEKAKETKSKLSLLLFFASGLLFVFCLRILGFSETQTITPNSFIFCHSVSIPQLGFFHFVPLVHKAKLFDYGFAVMGFFISCAIGHS